MAYDLEEQEQLDEFKAWWKKNGRMVTSLALAALVAYSAWQAYGYFQNKNATEASSLYQALVVTEPAKTAEIKAQSAKLMEDFSGTPYAGRAAVFAAKANFAANDSKSAKSQLEWAAKNAKESAVKAIASLQLAGILYGEKSYVRNRFQRYLLVRRISLRRVLISRHLLVFSDDSRSKKQRGVVSKGPCGCCSLGIGAIAANLQGSIFK